MVDPRGKLKYVFNSVFFKSFILMFQLGFELSYPRLDASIFPPPFIPLLIQAIDAVLSYIQSKMYGDNLDICIPI